MRVGMRITSMMRCATLISGADLAVGTLNTTLSDLSTHTGCIVTYVLVSDSRSAEAAGEAGFDVMSVATNHIKNCCRGKLW